VALGGLGAWLVVRSNGAAGVAPVSQSTTAGVSARFMW
jgi:hypothetical protein